VPTISFNPHTKTLLENQGPYGPIRIPAPIHLIICRPLLSCGNELFWRIERIRFDLLRDNDPVSRIASTSISQPGGVRMMLRASVAKDPSLCGLTFLADAKVCLATPSLGGARQLATAFGPVWQARSIPSSA